MKKVVIIGAGIAGRELLDELRAHAHLNLQVKGFIDDNPKISRKKIHKVPFLGNLKQVKKIIAEHAIDEVFIAMPSARGQVLRDIINDCTNSQVSFKIIPRTLDIIQGKVSLTNIREVHVEDLIGREVNKFEQTALINFFKNKTIIVTGACGSIGHEISRQLAVFSPKKIIFYDWWENGMFELEIEFEKYRKTVEIITCIGDIKDAKRLEKLFAQHKPDIAFHAAAFKHVPLMEKNISEAIKNNILGTKTVAETAKKFNVSHFILISTDKAVYPKSIMGATKLIAEGIIHSLSNNSRTKFISVRFGNVLDSFGSVLPLFKKQINQGGPITITHKDMKRFFMSIPEAVQLIFQATLIGKGGEIFILDMGEPIKIVDLAKLLIKLSGLQVDKDISIIYTGLRPGEKLTEELFTEKENLMKTKNHKIFSVKNLGFDAADQISSVEKLISFALDSDDAQCRKIISHMIPSLI